MPLAVHFLLGGLLITTIKPLWLAVVVIILSHYFLDILPHWDYPNMTGDNKKLIRNLFFILLDFLIGYSVALLFFKSDLALIGGFIGISVDILEGLEIAFNAKFLDKINRIHNIIHYPFPTYSLLKLLFSIFLILLFVLVYILINNIFI